MKISHFKPQLTDGVFKYSWCDHIKKTETLLILIHARRHRYKAAMPNSYKDKLYQLNSHITDAQRNATGWEDTALKRHKLLTKIFRTALHQAEHVKIFPYTGDEELPRGPSGNHLSTAPGHNDKMAEYVVKAIDWMASRITTLQTEVSDLTSLIDIVTTNKEVARCDMHAYEEEDTDAMDAYASASDSDEEEDEEEDEVKERRRDPSAPTSHKRVDSGAEASS
jgi:hypothetical protein